MEEENNVSELRIKATALRKHKNYSDAVNVYRAIWTDYRSLCNEWDGWGYAFCLRKLKCLEDALSVCREVYRIKKDFNCGRELYAWCIYDLEIKKDSSGIREETFLKGAEAIMSLCGFDPYSPYSPYVGTVFKVLDYLKSKAIYPSEEIMKWTDRVESEKLPFECYSRTDKSGKVLRISSYKEKWYLFRTEALFKLEQYKTCLDLCEEALIEIPGQHFLNAIWFKRRKALCKWHLQDREEALCELKDVLNQKKEWFIQHEIAGFYFEQGQIDDALSYALDSALNYGETEFKWELFCLIGLILKSKGYMDIAKKHILLSAKVREEKGWKIPEKLALLIEEFNLDPSSVPSSKELLTELKKHWISLKFSDKPKFTGAIKKILPNGKAGFIQGEKGKSYYFRVKSYKGHRDDLEEGVPVSFYLEKSFDHKKGKESEEAVRIELDY